MKKCNKILALLLVFVTIFSLTGCTIGHVKNKNEIIQWANTEYNINPKIILCTDIQNGKEYKMVTEDDVTFTVKTQMKDINIDGAILGQQESTISDYYKNLIEKYNNKILKIENKYNIHFLKDSNSGVINSVYSHLGNIEENKEEINKLTDAIKELRKIIKPTFAYPCDIRLVNDTNGEKDSRWYFVMGNDSSIVYHEQSEIGPFDSKKEFYDYQETTPQIEDDFKNYICKKYHNPKILNNSFILPKILLIMSFNDSETENFTQLYIDVTHYNELYKQYNGNIPEIEFEKLVMNSNEVGNIYEYKPYKDTKRG